MNNKLRHILLPVIATAMLAACSSADEIISGTALVATADEAAGENCEFGGTAVTYGVDLNENGTLDTAEVASTSYVCATEDGGVPLVSTSAEPAGDNCEFGGFAVSSGVDTNADGTLAGDEITDTTYACAGEPATPPAALGTTTAEAAGDNCEFGGQRVDVGSDLNGDGSLDSDEISSTSYVCASATATLASSSSYIDDADALCPGGYLDSSWGLDADGDDTLDESEVEATVRTCNIGPAFAAERQFVVTSCTDGAMVDLMPFDVDGTVETVSVVVDFSVETVELTVDDAGMVTLPAGAYTGGAFFTATATDNFGVESSAPFTLVFAGEGCSQIDTFYGVDPESCREVTVGAAGDDRGNVTLTSSWVYYNGDDSLIRTDRNLDNLEVVVSGNVDTLFHNNATLDLYSLWSSEFEFTTVGESEGALADDGNSTTLVWDEIAALDETTLAVLSTTTLDPAIPVPGSTYNYGTVDVPELLDIYNVFVAMRDDRFVAGIRGSSPTTFDDVILFRVYDAAAGTLLHSWSVTDSDEGYSSYNWSTQEVDVQNFPIFIREDVEYVILPVNGWNEVNLRDGTFTEASATYADNCDQQNLAIDQTGLLAYSHNEYGCWNDGIYLDEALAVCKVLLDPNDGSIDDSGVSGD